MNTYKITNVTNLVGKRDPKFNSVVNVEYIDNRTRKVKVLKPSESVFLTVQSLPLSVHRLRRKKLVDIVEISPAELQITMDVAKPKAPQKPKAVKKAVVKEPVVVEETIEEESVEKKPTTKKKTA